MVKSNQWQEITDNLRSTVDTATSLVYKTLESAKTFTKLQYEVASDMIDQSTATTKNLCSVSNAVDASNILKDLAISSVEKSLDTSKKFSEVIGETQTSFQNTVTSTFNASANLWGSVSSLASTVNPMWTNAAKTSVEKFIIATNKASDTIGTFTNKLLDIANNNAEQFRQTTISVLKQASSKTTGASN